MKNKMRKIISLDEKILKSSHAIFILLAAQIGISTVNMRKILGCAMNEITPVAKIVSKAIKKNTDK